MHNLFSTEHQKTHKCRIITFGQQKKQVFGINSVETMKGKVILTLSLTALGQLAQHFFEDQLHKEKLNIKI